MKVEFGVLFTSIEVDDKVISNFLGQINGQVVVSLTSEVDSTPVVLVAPTVPSIPTTVHHVSSTVPTTVPAQDIWSGCTSIKNMTPDHNKDLAKDFFDNYARGRGRLDDLLLTCPPNDYSRLNELIQTSVFLRTHLASLSNLFDDGRSVYLSQMSVFSEDQFKVFIQYMTDVVIVIYYAQSYMPAESISAETYPLLLCDTLFGDIPMVNTDPLIHGDVYTGFLDGLFSMSLFKDIAEGQQFSIFKYLPQLLMVGGNMPKMESLDAQTLIDIRSIIDLNDSPPVEDPLTAYEYGRLLGQSRCHPQTLIKVGRGLRTLLKIPSAQSSKFMITDRIIELFNGIMSKFFTALTTKTDVAVVDFLSCAMKSLLNIEIPETMLYPLAPYVLTVIKQVVPYRGEQVFTTQEVEVDQEIQDFLDHVIPQHTL